MIENELFLLEVTQIYKGTTKKYKCAFGTTCPGVGWVEKGGLHENTYILACKGLCKVGKRLNVDFRKIVQGRHTEVNTNVKL